MSQKTIFDLADKLGTQVSPWDNWTASNQQFGDPPTILHAYITNDGIRRIALDFQGKQQKKDYSTIIPVRISAMVIGMSDKLEVEFEGKKFQAYKKPLMPGSYEAWIDVKMPPPYQFKVFTFKLIAYESFTRLSSAPVVISATLDLKGGVVHSTTTHDAAKPQTISYHTFHDGRIEKHLPKNYDTKLQKGTIAYYYHDAKGGSHLIAEQAFHFVEKRKNGKKVNAIPAGHVRTYPFPKGGNAQTAYVFSNGDVYAKGTRYGIVKYALDAGFVQLIRMPDELNKVGDGWRIQYKFQNSQRRYCNPETFAGFIGALAATGFTDIVCTGMCFEDATSYPSVSHPNGDSADTGYLPTLAREQIKVNAFKTFNFKKIYRGQGWKMVNGKKVTTIPWLGQLTNSSYLSGHEDHLHAGEFDSSKIKTVMQ